MARYNPKFFDANYYLTQNADVAANWGGAPEDHFFSYGAAEGRKPAAWFDAQYIRAKYADLANMNAEQLFAHYNQYGFKEGRVTAAAYQNFDAAKYLADNADLGAAGITAAAALNHYLTYGQVEGRAAFNADGTAISTTTNQGQTFTLTTGNDLADVTGAYRNDSTTPFDFKFTAANEVVNASNVTLTGTDSLTDGSTKDADVLNLTLATGAVNGGAAISNIETINVTVSDATSAAAAAMDLRIVTGAKTLVLAGASGQALTFAGGTLNGTGLTTVDGSGLTSAVNGLTASFAGSTSTAALTIKGGSAADILTGVGGNDVISGGGGADTIVGGAGANTLNGDAGNDTITGGVNVDTIDGGAGDDTINAGLGNDIIVGGAGADTIATQGGTDTVTGGAGIDTITLTAGAGNSETIIFEAVAADNGLDVINNFAAGTVAAGGDVLKVSTLLGTTATYAGAKVAENAAYTAAAGENVFVISHVLGAALGNTGVTAAELQASAIRIGNSAKAIIIHEEGPAAGGADNAVAYYVTTDANGAYASVTAIATLVGIGTDGAIAWTAAQFA